MKRDVNFLREKLDNQAFLNEGTLCELKKPHGYDATEGFKQHEPVDDN